MIIVNSKQEYYGFKFFCVQILKLFITPKIISLNFLNNLGKLLKINKIPSIIAQ